PFLTQFQATLIDRSNFDQIIEAGESFDVLFSVKNLWASGVGAFVVASSPNQDINFSVDTITLGTLPGFGVTTTSSVPFKFTVANNITPLIDSIYFNFVSDGGLNNIRLGVQIEIGKPQVLVVNADQNGKYTGIYTGDLFNFRLPHRTHITQTSGLPTSALLSEFPVVIWYFGDHSTIAPSAVEIQRIKTYLDGGGNLMISGMNLAEQLEIVDPAFMRDYLHAAKSIQKYDALQRGVDGSRIGDGITKTQAFGNGGAKNWAPAVSAYAITPVDGAQPELKGVSTTAPNAFHAISFSGANKVVFFSFPFEAIEQDEAARRFRTQRDEILSRVLQFFNDIQTDVGPDEDIPPLPRAFTLAQNYPNPFNPTTTISYTINNKGGQRAPVTELVIYNTLGQKVRELVSRVEGPGSYQVEWDGVDDDGRQVSSGIYFYRLKRGNLSETKKMALLK
ncbi:MAG: T9SS type A sorting domain-containing protein, partial [candidate division Zixibacteria bacterium]|nr:T9SS type A sorting domain-containing protein [candidate division Zixibacteria bacterium]